MSLGKRVHVHNARLLGKAFGVLVAFAASIAIWWARAVMHPKDDGLVVLIALGLSAVTIVLGVSCWRDRTLQLTVYEHGIGWTRAGKSASVHFDNIAKVSELKINGKPAALTIVLHSGTEMTVSSNVSERELLLARIASRLPVNLPRAQIR